MPDFHRLDLDSLIDILKSDHLVMMEKFTYTNAESTTDYFVPPSRQEELILRIVLRYIEFNPVERIDKLPKILAEAVRLPLITASVLKTYKNNPLLATSTQCLAILDQAMSAAGDNEHTSALSSSQELKDMIAGSSDSLLVCWKNPRDLSHCKTVIYIYLMYVIM